MKIIGTLLLLGSFTLLGACGGGSTTVPGTPPPSTPPDTPPQEESGDKERGKLVYVETIPTGNTFTCVTCHALSEPTNDGFRRSGHPIGDALRRPSYKNGVVDTFLEAANSCLDEWMAVDNPWTASSKDYKDLTAFLESEDQGSGVAPALNFEIKAPLDTTSLKGDRMIGEAVFNQTCAICHGIGGGGTQQAPSLLGRNEPQIVAQRVRTSGRADSPVYTGLQGGGGMPFFATDRLSDAELTDIIAFLSDTGTGPDPDPDPGPNPEPDPDGSCASTHPNIGQVATLINRGSYKVSGSARIVDDCTIIFENFSYNGRGISVQIHGGTNGQYGSNFIVMDGVTDLRRSTPYVNESFTVTVPKGNTLDDLDGISVWCSGIQTSFGDGLFE